MLVGIGKHILKVRRNKTLDWYVECFKVLKEAQDGANNVTVTYLKFENIEFTVVTHSGHKEILVKKKNYEH